MKSEHRQQRQRLAESLLLLTLSFFATTASAQTYECVDSQGRNRYSALPCGQNETARDMRKIRKIGDKPAQSHDAYVQQEQEQREKEARAKSEEKLRREQEARALRLEDAAVLLEALRAAKEARSATNSQDNGSGVR